MTGIADREEARTAVRAKRRYVWPMMVSDFEHPLKSIVAETGPEVKSNVGTTTFPVPTRVPPLAVS
jgi:hypothetical protein